MGTEPGFETYPIFFFLFILHLTLLMKNYLSAMFVSLKISVYERNSKWLKLGLFCLRILLLVAMRISWQYEVYLIGFEHILVRNLAILTKIYTKLVKYISCIVNVFILIHTFSTFARQKAPRYIFLKRKIIQTKVNVRKDTCICIVKHVLPI